VDRPVERAEAANASEPPVFVSYATAARKKALALCAALERRSTRCWISCRDVAPGQNYQEAIVRSLRQARAMVLVFSDAANNSDEIKKELSLASRYHIPVLALRIEDVEPSDAFAYELSTRQWIDAFAGWDRSIDRLATQIADMPGSAQAGGGATAGSAARRGWLPRRLPIAAALAALLLAAGGAAWWFLRPSPAAAHSMSVRLTGFQRLSPDLPATMPDTMRDEIIAAFGDDAIVGVSTAPAPPAGQAPAYGLGGTINRAGNQIRVITRLINERSGTTLWSSVATYDEADLARVPRRIAVDAGRLARCGLFGASTYRKPLPDAVMADYLQYCHFAGVSPVAPQKGLDFARKVVAATPDFSWGWSAIAVAAAQKQAAVPAAKLGEVRQIGREAAGKALALDSGNAEALAMKAMLLDPADYIEQEKLLDRAIAARPLDCGCQHYLYGLVLENVGRFADAAGEFGRAVDMLALDGSSQFGLADALLVAGRPDEAKPHFAAVADLSRDAQMSAFVAVIEAPENGDYLAGIKAAQDPKLDIPAPQRAAFLQGFKGMAAHDPAAKAEAVRMLVALPRDQQDGWTLKLLAALGAHREALDMFAQGIGSRGDWASILWYPSMRSTLGDPQMVPLLRRLRLIDYWRKTGSRPDVCAEKAPPPFCRMI
jgi:hypothetical protein